MSLTKYTRDASLVQKRRAQTAIQSSLRGPERYLGLHALEHVAAPPVLTSFMGPAGSETMVVPPIRESAPSKADLNRVTKRRRDRVADAAQKLLDELRGISRQPSQEPPRPLPPPPPAEEQKTEEESSPPPPKEAEEETPSAAEPERKAEEPAPVEEKPAEEPAPVGETAAPAEDAQPAPTNDAPAESTVAEPQTVQVESEAPPPPPAEAAVAEEVAPPAASAEHPRAVTPPPPPAPVKRVTEGFLDKFAVGKSSFGSKNWKRRYFTLPLTGPLTYHEEKGSKALGTVPIDSATRLVTKPSPNTHSEVAEQQQGSRLIVIVYKDDDATRKLLLRCESESVHAEWCEQLRLRIATVDAAGDA